MSGDHPSAAEPASLADRFPSGWETTSPADLRRSESAVSVTTEVLAACLTRPEVRYVSVDTSGDPTALRVWVATFTAPTQQELDRLQAAHRGAVIIAMRLPPGQSEPSVGPSETLFRRNA